MEQSYFIAVSCTVSVSSESLCAIGIIMERSRASILNRFFWLVDFIITSMFASSSRCRLNSDEVVYMRQGRRRFLN